MHHEKVYAQLHIDDENNEVILDDVNEVLETMQITAENAEDESNHTTAAACIPFPEPIKAMSISCGFENIYEKVLKVQGHS